MRRRLFMITIGVGGLLVVFALLAFAYAPDISAALSPATNVNQPAPADTHTVDNNISATADKTNPTDVSVQESEHWCDKDAAASTGY